VSLANIKKLTESDMVPAAAAVVQKPIDGSSFWSVTDGNLLIHCVTKGSHQPLWCHQRGGSRLGRGVWWIPDLGTEVLISFDEGQFEGDAFIVGEFGRAPSGIAENTTLILDNSVELRSVGGVAEKMVKGETYRTNEDQLLSAICDGLTLMFAVIAAMNTDALLAVAAPDTSAAAVIANTAIVLTPPDIVTAAKSAFDLAASSYLATVGKVE
jgi:hypothetical protein